MSDANKTVRECAAFAVPPMMLGNASVPRSHLERGAKLVFHAEAWGDVACVLDDLDAWAYYRWRLEKQLGLR